MNTFKEHLKENRMDARKKALDKAREYVEDLAKELVNEYEDYDAFLGHMKKLVPQLDPVPGSNGEVTLPNETGPIRLNLRWFWEERKNEERL
jgi:uncharacterized short protein YbdD (DUF466 family)